METPRERLHSWLIRLVTDFREEIAKLPDEKQKSVSRTLEDFTHPCQITVIWAREPEFQILVLTRASELEDKLISICGPVENIRLIETIENELPSYPIFNLIGKERIEGFLADGIADIRQRLDPLQGPSKQSAILGQRRISDRPYAAGWTICGSLANLQVREVVDRPLRLLKSTATLSTSLPPKQDVILKGFGAHIYPSAWVGEIPKPRSFKERLSGSVPWLYSSQRVVTCTYKQRPLAVTGDGYIAVGEGQKSRALECLNEIMSTLLVLGTSVYVFRENDLSETTFTATGYSTSGSGTSPRLWFPIDLQKLLPRRTLIPKENIEKATKWAEILTADVRLKTLLLLSLEFQTHFMNSEYKQALVMGWVVLEDFYIKDLWTLQISKVVSDKDRSNKLGSWDVDRQLETLSLAHELNNDEYDLLMRIKDARNKTVHEGKDPAREVVEECSGMILEIVRKHIGTKLGMSLGKL
jgi:hypothetical protein